MVSRDSSRSHGGAELEKAMLIQKEHSDSMLQSSINVKSEIAKNA